MALAVLSRVLGVVTTSFVLLVGSSVHFSPLVEAASRTPSSRVDVSCSGCELTLPPTRTLPGAHGSSVTSDYAHLSGTCVPNLAGSSCVTTKCGLLPRLEFEIGDCGHSIGTTSHQYPPSGGESFDHFTGPTPVTPVNGPDACVDLPLVRFPCGSEVHYYGTIWFTKPVDGAPASDPNVDLIGPFIFKCALCLQAGT